MSDKELLELAAKAAGLRVERCGGSYGSAPTHGAHASPTPTPGGPSNE